MPVSFRILSDQALCYVRYDGRAVVQEGFDQFTAYMMHPDYRPGQKQLVDLSGITEIEHDFMALFEFQAGKASAFLSSEYKVLLVYLATTPVSMQMARQVQRSWEGLDGAVVRVATDWDGAMDILGLPRDALDDILMRGK